MSILTPLESLVKLIGDFFTKLFKDTKDSYNQLPKEQQDAIIQGVTISQIIKTGYQQGEDFVITEVSTKLNVSKDVAEQVILYALKSWGINVSRVQKGFDKLADTIESGLTSEGWNGLWQTLAQAAASWMSTGKLNWITLSLGVVEFIYQKLFKGVK